MKSKFHDLLVLDKALHPILDKALHPILKHFAVLRDKKKRKRNMFLDQCNWIVDCPVNTAKLQKINL